RPLGPGSLLGPVHEVAGESGGARRGGEPDADVTRRVTDPRVEAEILVELVVAVDEHGLPGLDHGHDAVGDAPRLLLARRVLVFPELPLRAGDDVSRSGEGRDPAPVLPARVPADV